MVLKVLTVVFCRELNAKVFKLSQLLFFSTAQHEKTFRIIEINIVLPHGMHMHIYVHMNKHSYFVVVYVFTCIRFQYGVQSS